MSDVGWLTAVVGLGLSPGQLAEGDSSAVWQGMLWLAFIAAGALAVTPVLVWLRRYLIGDARSTGSGLDLDHLRELRDRGELTIAEYERLRRQALGLSPEHNAEPPRDR